jgi:hypothetical protein
MHAPHRWNSVGWRALGDTRLAGKSNHQTQALSLQKW